MEMTDYEKKIIRALIRNPRFSDNKISKETGIPLKTVNRKRKDLEKAGIIRYLTYVDQGESGTGRFSGVQMYILRFRYGIPRKMFLDANNRLNSDPAASTIRTHLKRHVKNSFLCESQGQLVLVLMIESRVDEDILEIFNSDIVPLFNSLLGEGCIESTEALKVTRELIYFNNYPLFPGVASEIVFE